MTTLKHSLFERPLWIKLLFFLTLLTFTGYGLQYVILWGEAGNQVSYLKDMRDRMPIPPQTLRIKQSSDGYLRKANWVAVSEIFSSNATENEINSFYMKIFKSDGWTFKRQVHFSDGSGSIYIVCKGNYEITIQHNFKPKPRKWDYEMQFEWSVSKCTSSPIQLFP